MTTEPEISTNKAEDQGLQPLITPSPQAKHEIYPEVNARLKGAIVWLGLGFIVMVFLVQQFSGYS